MLSSLFIILFALAGPSTVAQPDDLQRFARPYLQAGFGTVLRAGDSDLSTAHVLAGCEIAYAGRIGVAGELGIGTAFQTTEYLVGVATSGLVVHLAGRSEAFDPYVTAGGSVLFRQDGVGVFTAGAGVTLKSSERMDIRLDVRDYFRSSVHLVEFRVGVGF